MVKTELNSERMKVSNPMFDLSIVEKRRKTIKDKGNWGNWNKGRKRLDLTLRNINNNPLKNESSMKKMINSRKHFLKEKYSKLEEREIFNKKMLKAQHKRPTKPEKILLNIIEKNNLPFNYVGNGQIMIGGFNPDFLSKNPKHIIEVNGDYWHNLPNIKEKDKRKCEAYIKYGYKVLNLWESELNNEIIILNKIKKFLGG